MYIALGYLQVLEMNILQDVIVQRGEFAYVKMESEVVSTSVRSDRVCCIEHHMGIIINL